MQRFDITEAQAWLAAHDEGMELCWTDAGLTLVGEGLELRGDFTRMLPRLKQGRLQGEMLVKAAKIKGVEGELLAVDATAGLGEDSILLAAAGFTVEMFECNPVIAALLRDALARATELPELAPIAARMRLTEANSVDALPQLGYEPDLVLLDPMFPAKRKDAASKKKMQLFQHMERPCEDEEALFRAAFDANPRKLVVKRPLKGPYLAGVKPSHSLKGKTIRYDCVLPRTMLRVQ